MNYEIEKEYAKRGFSLIAGMDEAGRGPLCGPVVSACIIMPKDIYIEGVNDSKKLSEKKREMLYPKILESALGVGVGIVYEKTIDEINILNSTKLAFKIAYENLVKTIKPQLLLIDGRDIIDTDINTYAVIKGDSLCYSIACASIIAKVTRDKMMYDYDLAYPEYGFAKNKGYGTKQHIAAIKTYGLCAIHRRSFTKNFV